MWRCEDCELTICDTNITNSVDRQQISAPKTGQTRTTLLLIAIPAGQRGMSSAAGCRVPTLAQSRKWSLVELMFHLLGRDGRLEVSILHSVLYYKLMCHLYAEQISCLHKYKIL